MGEYKFANGLIPLNALKFCAEKDGYEVGINDDGGHYIKHTCTAWLSTVDMGEQKVVNGFTAPMSSRVLDLALWLQAHFHVRIEFALDDQDAFVKACKFQSEVDQHKCLQHFLTIYCLLDLPQRNQLHRALLCHDEVEDPEVQNLLNIASSAFSEKESELLMDMLMRNAVAAMTCTENSYVSEWEKHKNCEGFDPDQFLQDIMSEKEAGHATA